MLPTRTRTEVRTVDKRTQAKVAEARFIISKAKAEDRDLTEHERKQVDRLVDDANKAKLSDELVKMMGGGTSDEPNGAPGRFRKLSECIREAAGGKAAVDMTPSALVSVDFLLPPGPTEGPSQAPLFNSFPLRQDGVNGGSARYLRQVGTIDAAVVPPATDKPTATFDLQAVDEAYKVVAVLTPPIAASLIADGGAELTRFLDGILAAAVYRGVDEYAAATIDAAPTGTQAFATDALTTLAKSRTALLAAGFNPTHAALNPADAEALGLLKGDAFYFGNRPSGSGR
jgi:hypothetical protein